MATGPRSGRWLEHASPTTRPQDLEAMFDALEQDLAGVAMRPSDIVRNRLFAASRDGRDAASAIRFAQLSGAARCATSSYIDLAGFPTGDGVRTETLALAGAGNRKLAVEYEPPQPPCRFVATGDHVFLSGLTSIEPDFDDQVRDVGRRIAETLELAGVRLGRPVKPARAEAWLHRSVGLDDAAELASRVGLANVPLRIRRCDGFSKPGKLVEVEIDARSPGPS